jgi:hypothetical protein
MENGSLFSWLPNDKPQSSIAVSADMPLCLLHSPRLQNHTALPPPSRCPDTGTAAWDFPPPVFFCRSIHIIDPDSYPFFEFAFKFVWLLCLIVKSMIAEIFPLHDAVGIQIFLLHFAAGSQILPLHGGAVWQRGVKFKSSGRLPRPLKGQSCHKNHIWGTFSILVPNYNVKLQIQLTPRTWSKRRKDFRLWIGDPGGYFWWDTVGQKSGATVPLMSDCPTVILSHC